MQDLAIALIQFDISWQNPNANRQLIESKIERFETNPDLIVLPEMFTTGFTMEVKSNAEPPDGETLQWMQSISKSSGAAITGSIIITEGGNYYNRIYFVKPNGEFNYYNKRHLFRMADEDHHFSPGDKSHVFELRGWKIKPLICYDLRFPVWSRNTDLAYDLIIYVANWPEARINAWDTLLQARAIENLCYSVGVNRVGFDGNNKNYNGHSGFYNFKGEPLNNLTENTEVICVTLSKAKLERFRKSFPAHLDADSFTIT